MKSLAGGHEAQLGKAKEALGDMNCAPTPPA